MMYAEKSAEKAGGLIDEADRALEAMQPDKAESKLAEANKILSEPDVAYYPERDMLLGRLKDDEARLAQVRTDVAKRQLGEAVADRRKAIDSTQTKLKKAVDDLHAPGLATSQVKSARSAVEEMQSEIDRGKELESKDKPYADYAHGLKKVLDQAAGEIRQADKTVAFLEGPGAGRKKGAELAKEAEGEKDAHKRHETLTAARDKFKACVDEGRKMLSASPDLKKAVIVLEESVTSPDGIVAECASREAALQKSGGEAGRTVAFVDGPAAARKDGVELLKKAESENEPAKRIAFLTEARNKLKACATQGRPMLADKILRRAQLPSDDAATTPEAIVADCVARERSLLKASALAGKALVFLKGPGEVRRAAQGLAKEADGEKDPARRVLLLTRARDRFKVCIVQSKNLLAADRDLGRMNVAFHDGVMTPQALFMDCVSRGVALDKEVVEAMKAAKAAGKATKGKRKI
jgi:hypothetical protein